jgi:hypothetical protein
MSVRMECAPAFNYARSKHAARLVPDHTSPPSVGKQDKVIFTSAPDSATNYDGLSLDLRFVAEMADENAVDGSALPLPKVDLTLLDLTERGLLGPAAAAELEMVRYQSVVVLVIY